MADKTITYKGNETVLPEKPMSLGNGLKSMPVTAAEQVVVDFATDMRLPEYIEDKANMNLLWENASPTSTFGQQTVSVPIIIGEEYAIDYSVGADMNRNGARVYFKGGESGQLICANKLLAHRTFSSRDSGVSFNTAVKYTTYNSDANTDNTFGIPLRIYKVRGK